MDIKVNAEEFLKELQKTLSASVSEDIVKKMALEARNAIYERTVKDGVDVNLAPFKPLSETPIYVSKKVRPSPKGGEATRGIKGQRGKTMFFPGGYEQYKDNSGGKAILQLTGKMLHSMQVISVMGKTFILGFKDTLSNLKAKGHNEGVGNLPQREFFGLNDKDGVRLQKLWERLVGRMKNYGK